VSERASAWAWGLELVLASALESGWVLEWVLVPALALASVSASESESEWASESAWAWASASASGWVSPR
jgi:hypothetical protein